MTKKVLTIGVTSSIALYKVVDMVEILSQKYQVNVILTSNAMKLIEKNDFQVFVEDRIYSNTFRSNFNYKDYIKNNKKIDHIGIADETDLFVIVPATANIIGKISNGIADDLLSTTFLAYNGQTLVAPAMNTKMWENSIVQENIEKLKKHSIEIIDPEYGELACGYKGQGRLAEGKKIIQIIDEHMLKSNDLKGKNVVVSAGPTVEEIDPVRYISNKSSGKMGFAIAKAAKQRGANVTLITGKTNLINPYGVNVVNVRSAHEMRDAVNSVFDECDIFVSAAAVADFRVEKSEEKIKKKDYIDLKLEKNPDILYEMGTKKKNGTILVGFALETNDIIENAKKKLAKKNLDLIVANGTTALNSDVNSVKIIDSDGSVEYTNMSKVLLGHKIFDRIKEIKPDFS